MTGAITGLYAVTPPDLPRDQLLATVGLLCRAGLPTLQLRDKALPFSEKVARAKALRPLCHDCGTRFIINDDPILAQEVQADGVHVGCADAASLAEARKRAGHLHLGVSCQGDVRRGEEALGHGADAISFGAIFPTISKAGVVTIGLKPLRQARLKFPQANILAIGGISLENITAVRQAGADAVALIAALFSVRDPAAALSELTRRWQEAL